MYEDPGRKAKLKFPELQDHHREMGREKQFLETPLVSEGAKDMATQGLCAALSLQGLHGSTFANFCLTAESCFSVELNMGPTGQCFDCLSGNLL